MQQLLLGFFKNSARNLDIIPTILFFNNTIIIQYFIFMTMINTVSNRDAEGLREDGNV